jgi:hypothetical protein
MAQAFTEHPTAEWLWWLDLDAIIMTSTILLGPSFLSHAKLAEHILNSTEIHLGDDTRHRPHIETHPSPRIADIDLLIAQDHNGFNAGSFWLRRSAFSRFLMEMWVDPFFMDRDAPGREQDAIFDLFLQHTIVREHTALVDLHWLNAYSVGGEGWGWREGDLAVHFAGCWVDHRCTSAFEEFWSKRIVVEDLPEGKERLRRASRARGGLGPVFS